MDDLERARQDYQQRNAAANREHFLRQGANLRTHPAVIAYRRAFYARNGMTVEEAWRRAFDGESSSIWDVAHE